MWTADFRGEIEPFRPFKLHRNVTSNHSKDGIIQSYNAIISYKIAKIVLWFFRSVVELKDSSSFIRHYVLWSVETYAVTIHPDVRSCKQWGLHWEFVSRPKRKIWFEVHFTCLCKSYSSFFLSFLCSTNLRKFRRKWTQEEDDKLHAAIKELGDEKWKKIADKVGTRNHGEIFEISIFCIKLTFL